MFAIVFFELLQLTNIANLNKIHIDRDIKFVKKNNYIGLFSGSYRYSLINII
jgi:hypothetical protein